MKTIEIEQLPEDLAKALSSLPHERVLLTKHGKPYAMVSDVSDLDAEDISYIADPAFWEMIADRRQRRGGVTLDEAFRRLEAREAGEAAQQARDKRK